MSAMVFSHPKLSFSILLVVRVARISCVSGPGANRVIAAGNTTLVICRTLEGSSCQKRLSAPAVSKAIQSRQ